jgi:hypothetical protein
MELGQADVQTVQRTSSLSADSGACVGIELLEGEEYSLSTPPPRGMSSPSITRSAEHPAQSISIATPGDSAGSLEEEEDDWFHRADDGADVFVEPAPTADWSWVQEEAMRIRGAAALALETTRDAARTALTGERQEAAAKRAVSIASSGLYSAQAHASAAAKAIIDFIEDGGDEESARNVEREELARECAQQSW